MHRLVVSFVPIVSLSFLAGGCVLAPRGMRDEQLRLANAGQDFERPLPERTVPALLEEPRWQDLLRHAFLSNGELESAYLEWKAAVSRVAQAAGYPNTNVSLGFEYLFSNEKMKGWDRTTLTLGFDPMRNLSLPPKVLAAGRVAFADARAAGKRFQAAKFDLQRRVLTAFVDYALAAERARFQRARLSLLQLAADTARASVQTGAAQRELLTAEVDLRTSETELRTSEAELPQQQAMLNALIGRDPRAPLEAPRTLPAARSVPGDDAALLHAAVDNNPELAALAEEVRGRQDALTLARLQYLPDINPFVGITGGIQQVVGAAITLSTMLPQLRAAIDEARTLLRRSEAMARQTRLNRGATFVATLVALRDGERQQRWLEQQIIPAVELLVTNARVGNATGSARLAEVIASERALLDLRLLVAETRALREKRVAELEALSGVDFETLMPVEDRAGVRGAWGSAS